MKKLLSILIICLACLFAFASCNDEPDEPTPTPEQPEHIHKFGEWEIEEESTCTEDGISARYCSCGEKQEKPVPTIDHDWKDATCTKPKTCSSCRATNGDALGHNYVNEICQRCGDPVPASGLFDADNNLVASWDTLVNDYGMNISKDYTVINYDETKTSPSYILTNIAALSKGVKIIIDESVASIGDYAFYGCADLTYVEIHNSVTSIGKSTFSRCTGLTSFVIPDGIKYIGKDAFNRCDNLISVVIPDSVKLIGEDAFCHCYSLTSINVDENNEYYKSIDGNLYTKDGKTLIKYAIGKTETSFEIPNGVTIIHKDVFSECDSLTSILIPESVSGIVNPEFFEYGSVTMIVNSAFFGCDNLTSIIVDENNEHYKSIDGNLYTKDGKKLVQYAYGKTETSFEIPDGVTSIDYFALDGCEKLTTIVIPDSLTNIASWAFRNCGGLTDVYYTGSEEEWSAIMIGIGNDLFINASIHYDYISEE